MSGAAIAVTGATGLLGGHLARSLRASGAQVRALVRDPAAFASSAACAGGVAAYRCDLPDAIDPAGLAGAHALVHCAYATRTRDAGEARRVDEDGTRALLAAARTAGVERFVFVSSTSAAADAPTYYGRSKHLLELALDPARDLVLRPGLVLAASGGGLFARLRAAVRRSPLVPLVGGGRELIQTVHVDDVCAALAIALERELVGALTLAEPEGLPFRELLAEIAAREGVRRVLLPVPMAPFLVGLRAIEALRLPFPVSSENLLGLRALRVWPTGADEERLGMRFRTARESLDELMADGAA